MKILLAHNFYGSAAPSGENQVFAAERRMLLNRGHTVGEFTRNSDEVRSLGLLGAAIAAITTPWNFRAVAKMREEIARLRPDVVHAHNTFPLISPAVFRAVPEPAARVLTLHNYRLFCAAAIALRDGRVCTECLDARSAFPAVRYGCYRNSRVATTPLALSIALHRRLDTWGRHVDAFIALSEFQRDLVVRAGLPADRVWVKPNFTEDVESVIPWSERPRRVVYVGRLGEEKGVRDLVEAWAAWGSEAPELLIVGDGPLRNELADLASGQRLKNVRFLGQLPPSEARSLIAASRLLVLPSIWFETFGLVVIEAFARATPVAVSQIGSLPEMVLPSLSGVALEPRNSENLKDSVRSLWQDEELHAQMSRNARQEFESRYSESANHEMLLNIYREAIARRLGTAAR